MSEQYQQNPSKPPTGRLVWGTIILVVGFLSPALIPAVIASGWSTGVITVLSGLLAFGIPELFMIIAVAVMGKEGLAFLKKQFFGFLQRYVPDEVSPTRYTIGLILFFLPITFGILLPYLAIFFPFFITNMIWFVIPGDVMLFISLFVLGGHFWDKLRSLFFRNARAVMTKDVRRET